MTAEQFAAIKRSFGRTALALDSVKAELKNPIVDKKFKSHLIEQQKTLRKDLELLTEIINDNEECANPS